jgi:hypothetical protein
MRAPSIQTNSEQQMLSALSALAHACRARSDAAQEPAVAYEEFVAAVARRDAQAVLARMSDDYGKSLRLNRHSRSFATFFQLWCEDYPRHVEVAACFVDGDSAILETRVEHAGAALAGCVILELQDDAWRVGSERCADGRTRIPTGQRSPRREWIREQAHSGG